MLAPAKLNLHLRVVGRRRDGYHLLESLVVPVSLFDRVVVRRGETRELRLRCSAPGLGGHDNLAWRAAALLRESSGCEHGAEITLSKRIPAGAGLGGGSSDAAAVLWALNEIWGLRLPQAALARIGARIGADVPFFVHRRPAVVRGIGDRVRVLSSFPASHFVIAWPGFAISTKSVYESLNWRAPRRPAPSPLAPFLRDRISLEAIFENDLEASAARRHPRVRTLRRALERLGAQGACMSGSGSAVFGLFPSRRAAQLAARELRQRGIWSFAVHSLAEAPSPTARGPIRIRRIR